MIIEHVGEDAHDLGDRGYWQHWQGSADGVARMRCGPVRGLTRDAARAGFPTGVEAVEADFTVADQIGSALDGVRSLFLLLGLGFEVAALNAAQQAEVEHVVIVSTVTVQSHPQLPSAAASVAAEELLKGSGMAWTILRPTQFASNTLMWAPSIRDHRAVRVPYPDEVLDLMGGDVNDELLAVRDTVARVTGRPAMPFADWARENAGAFRV